LANRLLRSLKPLGGIQELFALIIARYAMRFLMHEEALQRGIDPDRLSFVHALRVLQDASRHFKWWHQATGLLFMTGCWVILPRVGYPNGVIVPIRVWSSARCRSGDSNDLSTMVGHNPHGLSVKLWPLFEWYWF
jgi:hypothetical protein